MKHSHEKKLPIGIYSSLPITEIIGNREVTIEGSTGVLKYESDNIKVNTGQMVISLEGRGMELKFFSSSSLIIEGNILKIEYIM